MNTTRDQNEIASAVYHLLTSIDLSAYNKIRLCADGCGGQNRNSTMVGMCMYFLEKAAPPALKSIELVFPVRGHSFLPSDRVFGRIEKKLKKMPVITDPEEYITLFKEHGTVRKLQDAGVKDWKEMSKNHLKGVQSWHFKFSLAKRFFIEKESSKDIVTVRGEENYMVDLGDNKSIFKRGKRCHQMEPSQVDKGIPINSKKLTDVKKLLLAHFGENWSQNKELSFYESFVKIQEGYSVENDNEEGSGDHFCEGGQEEVETTRI